jgi:tetratricopeptide (TPR) repeat protein
MKRSILMLACILIAGMSFAQMKKDRTSAYNYWQKNDFVKAKQYIDQAITYPEAATDAKLWYYRGGIYLDIHLKPEFKILAPEALNVSYESYKKAKELDTKGEYSSDISPRLQKIQEQLFNEGATFFEANELDKALSCFNKAISLGKENGIVDTVAIYGTALTYEKQGDKANAIKAYDELVNLNMNKPGIYASLSTLYKETNQIDKAEKIVELGLQAFPGNNEIIIAQTNLYITTNQHEKALKNLKMALEKEPNNLSMIYATGVTYDLLKNDTLLPADTREKYFQEAIAAYEATLKLDPNFFDALFNLGVIYFNKGGDIINAANKLPLSESAKYEQMMTEGNNNLRKALPYFETAESINGTDMSLLVSLKEVYTRLNMTDKIKAVNEKIQSIGGK